MTKEINPLVWANPQPPIASLSGPVESFSIRDIFDTIWRRKSLILIIAFGITFAAGLILTQIAPSYSSAAQVLIESRGTNIVNLKSVAARLSADEETIASEIEILRSRQLAKKVILSLKLDRDREFNQTLAESDKNRNNWGRMFGSIKTALFGTSDQEFSAAFGLTEEQIREEQRLARIINTFLDHINVYRTNNSRVITVEAISKNPVTAASIANKLVNVYIEQQLDSKFEATRNTTGWLNQRVWELRRKLDESETAVEKFRQEYGLLEGRDGNLISQEISDINAQLIIAKTLRTEAEVRLSRVKGLVGSEKGIGSANAVLQSELIQTLRGQEAQLQRDVAKLSTEYGKLHPKMITPHAELKRLQEKIKTEISKIVQGQKNEVVVAGSREASLQASLNKLKLEVAEANRDEIKLNALKREAEADRILLNTFLARFKETRSQEYREIQQPDMTIISRAFIPSSPSYPKKFPIIVLAFLGSSFLGVVIVFVIEHVDPSYRSGEQIESLTGLPSLGFVPLIKDLDETINKPASYINKYPKSPYGESINSLRWAIDLQYSAPERKTILVTSTQPNEGKTSIVVSLAKRYAMAGKRVLVIDADRSSWGVSKALYSSGTPKLIDTGIKGTSILAHTRLSDHRLQSILRVESNVSEILTPENIERLLGSVCDLYDTIIIDSPAIAVASDALILSKTVDTTVFVVRWGKTKRQAVNLALKNLQKSGSPIAGVLLSMVDAKKYALYGYGDSGFSIEM